MAVGISSTNSSLSSNHLREGYGRPHNLFLTRLAKLHFVQFTTFFDYGCSTCYVSSWLAKELLSYDSKSPATISGIGGKGPRVDVDALVEAQFQICSASSSSLWSIPFTVSVGVLPDNTFPGDLTLGQTMFHALGLTFNKDGTICMLKLKDQPTLQPLYYVQNSSHYLASSTTPSVNWNISTSDTGVKFGTLHSFKFPSLFNKSIRHTDVLFQTRHRINTGNHTPIKIPPRRYSPQQQEAIRHFCKTHEGLIIRKSKGPWAAPLLLTPKKSNNPNNATIWRICVDYRELNKVTKKHAHPLPNAYDEIQRASGHNYYAFLDLENGFWHIPMYPDDCEKTAFVTPFGIYEWLVMPFGLCNAPATFQCFMEEVLEPFRPYVAGLLDDVVVWADTVESLHSKLMSIFSRFVQYGLILNASKCKLFVPDGVFLGFLISKNGISADPAKVAAIHNRPIPSTTSEIRGFVNAAGYLRSLIKDFSKLSGPLTDQSLAPKNKAVT